MDKFLTFPGLLLPLMGLALLASCGADARVAKETPLLTRALPDMPGSCPEACGKAESVLRSLRSSLLRNDPAAERRSREGANSIAVGRSAPLGGRADRLLAIDSPLLRPGTGSRRPHPDSRQAYAGRCQRGMSGGR